jgi:hypothetical protein
MSDIYNINLVAGNTLLLSVTASDSNGNPINLSGYSARGHVKYNYGDTGILLDLNPQIHSSYTSGLVNISGAATQTALLPVGKFPYNLEIESTGGYVTKFLRGYISVDPETTIE